MALYPWAEIKAKYETGKYSMKELSEEYGFNASYGRRKARQNNWQKGKSTRKVTKRAAKKVLEVESDKEAKLRKEYAKIIKNIRRGAVNEMFRKANPSFERLKSFKITSEIITNCKKADWDIHGISEVADQLKLDGNLDCNVNPIDAILQAENELEGEVNG